MSAPAFGIRGSDQEPEYDVDAVRAVLEGLRYRGDVDKVAEGLTDPTVVIAWRLEQSGAHVRLFEMDTAEFQNLGSPWDYIQRTYGAGKYRVDVQRTRGASPLLASMTERLAALPGAPAAAPAPAPSALEDRMDRIERALEKLADRGAGGGAAAPGFFDAVATIGKAMGEQNAGLLKALIEMKGGGDRGTSTEKLLEILVRGIELGKESGGGGEGFGSVLREFLPPALRELRAMGAGGLPALPPGAPPAPPAADPNAHLPTWARVLAPQFPELMQLARLRADPEHWAEQICAQVDPERLTFIEDQLRRGPVFREEFFTVFEDAMGHRSWFEMFFDAMAAEIAELRDESGGVES